MTTKLLIDRELLEHVLVAYEWQLDSANQLANYAGGTGPDESEDEGVTKLRAILATPRQPEVDGLEVVATLRVEFDDAAEGVAIETVETHVLCDEGETDLCRLSDAQRAIAELREECSFLKDCQENAMLHMTGLVTERDTLLQQRDRLASALVAASKAESRAEACLIVGAALAEVEK